MTRPISLPIQVQQSQPTGKDHINPETGALARKEQAFLGFEKLKQERFNQINDHELAHQRRGGSQAGGISIETDANGIAFAGHVPIQMPSGVNKANPDESYRMAEVAFSAALAPSDPSSADLSIANRSQVIMSQAMGEMNKPCVAFGKNKPPGMGKNLDIVG